MQPGKPQGFGRIGPDRTPLFALPGNPVSAYVSFEVFVRPAIRTLMGAQSVHREVVQAACTTAIDRSPEGRRQFLRGHYDRKLDKSPYLTNSSPTFLQVVTTFMNGAL